MSTAPAEPPVPPLLTALGQALDAAPRPVREIEVGIALSIELGRRRPAVACGGCKTPLEYRGIPAVTNAQLKEPFRLRFADD